MGAFQQGAQSFPALREAYLSAGDPKAKSMVLPLLMFVGGEEARDLVIDQVHSETDPELKKALTRLSVRYATPDHVAELKATYLDVLRSDDSNAEARMAALDGLRYADGDDLQEVLLEAAGDKSEPVRLAAIQALSSRPAMRQQLEDLVHNETSPRVREVGECRLLLSAGES
jgi:hypothetical protein